MFIDCHTLFIASIIYINSVSLPVTEVLGVRGRERPVKQITRSATSQNR
jgi:hypothetical protein